MGGDLIPSTAEAARSVAGILTLLQRRPQGFALLDVSREGFFRSFGAFLWCWPAQTFLWTMIWRDVPEIRPEGLLDYLWFFAITGFCDIAAWIIPVLLMIPAARIFGFGKRFSTLIVATNWFGLVAVYVAFIPGTVRLFVPIPVEVSQLLALVFYGIVIGLFYRVAKMCLGNDAMLGALVTMITLISGLFISETAYRLLGLTL